MLEELFKALLHKLMTGEIRVGDLELNDELLIQTREQGGVTCN